MSETELSVRQIGEIVGPNWEPDTGILLQLEGKLPGYVPPWLRCILNRDFGEYFGFFPGEWSWVDHWGAAGDTFITEPYGLPSDDVRQIVEFCDRYGLDFHISALSEHYPTHTVCVEIWPRRNEERHDGR